MNQLLLAQKVPLIRHEALLSCTCGHAAASALDSGMASRQVGYSMLCAGGTVLAFQINIIGMSSLHEGLPYWDLDCFC